MQLSSFPLLSETQGRQPGSRAFLAGQRDVRLKFALGGKAQSVQLGAQTSGQLSQPLALDLHEPDAGRAHVRVIAGAAQPQRHGASLGGQPRAQFAQDGHPAFRHPRQIGERDMKLVALDPAPVAAQLALCLGQITGHGFRQGQSEEQPQRAFTRRGLRMMSRRLFATCFLHRSCLPHCCPARRFLSACFTRPALVSSG